MHWYNTSNNRVDRQKHECNSPRNRFEFSCTRHIWCVVQIQSLNKSISFISLSSHIQIPNRIETEKGLHSIQVPKSPCIVWAEQQQQLQMHLQTEIEPIQFSSFPSSVSLSFPAAHESALIGISFSHTEPTDTFRNGNHSMQCIQ